MLPFTPLGTAGPFVHPFASGPFGSSSGGGGGPGPSACALAGLPPGCSWIDLGAEAIGAIFGGGGGSPSGSEPPQGSPVVPGLPETTPVPFQPQPPAFAPTLPMRCPDGSIPAPDGTCFNLPGGPVTGGGVFLGGGEPVHGQYGVGVVPVEIQRSVSDCPTGMVLGTDGVCYNRRDLRRSERMWPPGRKPLLTGGELNAIRTAARAAGKMKRQQKRLEKLGLLKRPTRRSKEQHHHHRGPVVIDTD